METSDKLLVAVLFLPFRQVLMSCCLFCNELFPLFLLQEACFGAVPAAMPVSLPAQRKQGRNEALDVITGTMICMADVHAVGGDFPCILEKCLFSVAEYIFGTEHFFPL